MIPATDNKIAQNILICSTLTALCVAGTASLIGWLLRYSAYGLDFTDEGFYLFSMANPFIYDYSHTQFGFIYHPIYSWLGGDIVKLRQANMLTTFMLAWGLSYLFLSSFASQIKHVRFTLLVVAAGLATSALIEFQWWLITPNYNGLVLQALIIVAIGLILTDKNTQWVSMIGWSLVGIGGWLAFMAKPSTALALTVAMLLYLLFARKFPIKMILLSMAVSVFFLWLSAFFIDGEVAAFLNRIQRAIEYGRILGGGHTLVEMLRLDNFSLPRKAKIAIALVGILVGVAMYAISSNNKKMPFLGLLISTIFFAITASLIFGSVYRFTDFGSFRALLIFGLLFATIFFLMKMGGLGILKNIAAPQWALAGMFLAMPHISAFGSNGNYWQQGSLAAFFWLLAGLTLLRPLLRDRLSWVMLLPLAIAAQSIAAVVVKTGFEQPYRQPQSIKLNDSVITIGLKPSTLVLPKGYADYISHAIHMAQNNGFITGTSMIDLSGQSPGLLYALGAEGIGMAWLSGGYPGILELSRLALNHTSCEKIASAWVLLEPDGPRNISNDLMHGVGSVFPGGYSRVATWETAAGAGGYSEPRRQELYKPTAVVEGLENCNRFRMNTFQD